MDKTLLQTLESFKRYFTFNDQTGYVDIELHTDGVLISLLNINTHKPIMINPMKKICYYSSGFELAVKGFENILKQNKIIR